MWLAIVALAAVAGCWLWVERRRELFCVSFREGTPRRVRGRIPPGLLQDFEDALKRQGVERARLRAIRSPNGAQLRMSGLDEFQEQRLRNIFRLSPVSADLRA